MQFEVDDTEATQAQAAARSADQLLDILQRGNGAAAKLRQRVTESRGETLRVERQALVDLTECFVLQVLLLQGADQFAAAAFQAQVEAQLRKNGVLVPTDPR